PSSEAELEAVVREVQAKPRRAGGRSATYADSGRIAGFQIELFRLEATVREEFPVGECEVRGVPERPTHVAQTGAGTAARGIAMPGQDDVAGDLTFRFRIAIRPRRRRPHKERRGQEQTNRRPPHARMSLSGTGRVPPYPG